MRIALAAVGTTGDVRPFAVLAGNRCRSAGARATARALAAAVGGEDGIGSSVTLLERTGTAG